MLIPNKFNGHSPDGTRKYHFGLGVGEAALGASLFGAETGVNMGIGAAAAASAGEALGAGSAGILAGEMGDILPGTAGNMGNAATSGLTMNQLANAGSMASLGSRVLNPSLSNVYGNPLVQSSVLPGDAGSLLSTQGATAGPVDPSATIAAPNVAAPAGPTVAQQNALDKLVNDRMAADAVVNQQIPNKDGSFLDWFKNKDGTTNWLKVGGTGLGIGALASALSKPSLLPLHQPQTGQQVGLGATLSPNYAPQRRFAEGGLTEPGIIALHNPYDREPQDTVSAAQGGVMGLNMYPMSQQHVSQYATPSQLPIGAHQVAMEAQDSNFNRAHMASGGIAQLAVGGKLLKGQGDGMSDSLKANIDGVREARLADGEFVIPADVVSHLGNGSTDAGAKQLHAMMDKVRKARTGNKKQGKQINPNKYIPV